MNYISETKFYTIRLKFPHNDYIDVVFAAKSQKEAMDKAKPEAYELIETQLSDGHIIKE